ncbi:PilN domain-containing protein [Xanthomonas hyacinthi]|uniref:Fimbrial protein n=1 Tax=Xanthomonas hyacinthi TaxID=56455 RepID=A0A2S7ETK4_9XANT|nr:hypothetical protein [Xanthomonas hyacinthi]KLD74163.1 hypothetical protein Y886_34115 [Xanthomonas hyacinthi DSM 19077]PPU96457.1 hypothetical protein XhyaCFBP1156_15255 [Xanthomonas hyacinthi]QGY78879.1 PilN domain-containing protein [Xanthomonas hyacinthi]
MKTAGLHDLAWRSRPRWRAWALLAACALAAGGVLGWAQHRVDQRLQLLVDRRPAPASAPSMPTAAADPLAGIDKAGLERVEGELRMLNRDWPGLLAAIVPQDRHTRLLSLDVNPASGNVIVTGRAPGHAAVSTYVMELNNSSLIQEVRLLRIEGLGGGTVFEVSAQWR